MSNNWITDVPIRNIVSGRVLFLLCFYGARVGNFTAIPGGSAPIRSALKRRGLDPDQFFVSIFDLRERQGYK